MSDFAYQFAIKFISENSTTTETVQTGDYLPILVALAFAFLSLSLFLVFYLRRRKLNFVNAESSTYSKSQSKFNAFIIIAIVCSLVITSILFVYSWTIKAHAEEINANVPTVNAFIADDGSISVDDLQITNTSSDIVKLKDSSIVLNDAVKEDAALQNSILKVNGLGGAIYEGNPNGEIYITTDAFDNIKPGESVTVSVNISNLNAVSALKYVDQIVYVSTINFENAVVQVPVSQDSLYNGLEHTGVIEDNHHYTLAEGIPDPGSLDIGARSATHVNRNSVTEDPHNYITQVTLNPGFIWEDTSLGSDPIQLTWKISPLVAEFQWPEITSSTYNDKELEYEVTITNLQPDTDAVNEKDSITTELSIKKDGINVDVIKDAGVYRITVVNLVTDKPETHVADYSIPEGSLSYKDITIQKRTLNSSELNKLYMTGQENIGEEESNIYNNWYIVNYGSSISPSLDSNHKVEFLFSDGSTTYPVEVDANKFSLTGEETDVDSYKATLTANNDSNFQGNIQVDWFIYQPSQINIDTETILNIECRDTEFDESFVARGGFDTLKINPLDSSTPPYGVLAECSFVGTIEKETYSYFVDGSTTPGPITIDVPKRQSDQHIASVVNMKIKYYYTIPIQPNYDSFGNIYDSESGYDSVTQILGDKGTGITFETPAHTTDYGTVSILKFTKDGQEVKYYARANESYGFPYFFKEWTGIPSGIITESITDPITANFNVCITPAICYKGDNNPHFEHEDGIKWSPYFNLNITGNSWNLYCDDPNENLGEFIRNHGYVKKADGEYYYIQGLTVTSDGTQIVDGESLIFAQFSSDFPNIPWCDEVDDYTVANAIDNLFGSCWVVEKDYLTKSAYFSWNLASDYPESWINNYVCKLDGATVSDYKIFDFSSPIKEDGIEWVTKETTSPDTPLEVKLTLENGETHTITLQLNQEAFNEFEGCKFMWDDESRGFNDGEYMIVVYWRWL